MRNRRRREATDRERLCARLQREHGDEWVKRFWKRKPRRYFQQGEEIPWNGNSPIDRMQWRSNKL